jgi:hypothetical protein
MESALSCFDTSGEAAAAAPSSLVAACDPLQVFDGNFAGTTLSIFTSGWTNLGAFANITSSWSTGCKQGKLSDLINGGGTQRSLAANSSEVLPSTFNNKADAAWRP